MIDEWSGADVRRCGCCGKHRQQFAGRTRERWKDARAVTRLMSDRYRTLHTSYSCLFAITRALSNKPRNGRRCTISATRWYCMLHHRCPLLLCLCCEPIALHISPHLVCIVVFVLRRQIAQQLWPASLHVPSVSSLTVVTYTGKVPSYKSVSMRKLLVHPLSLHHVGLHSLFGRHWCNSSPDLCLLARRLISHFSSHLETTIGGAQP